MNDKERMMSDVAAALEREPSANLHRFPHYLEFSDGVLTLEGDVEHITAKKRALEVPAALPGVAGIIDRLRKWNIPAEPALSLEPCRRGLPLPGAPLGTRHGKVMAMQGILGIMVGVVIMFMGGGSVMAIEEAEYRVVMSEGLFELRDYAPHVLAETVVDGTLEEAGNLAFRRLFRYISGENRSRGKISMTAPVSQEAAGEKIPMAAPVGQQASGGKWTVSFMMPVSYTLATLPVPDDPAITLRPVPARRMAAVRYSGTWSEKNYLRYRGELESWMRANRITAVGEPVWARYNPPFTLWFLRRNEILIPVAEDYESRSLPTMPVKEK